MKTRNIVASVLLLAAAQARAEDVSMVESAPRSLGEYLERWEDAAPSRLVVFGHYSDRRFIDMMTPHHAMAVRMAELALVRAEHPELRQMAQSIVESQAAEIDELKAIKQSRFGTAETPARMSPIAMENMGMASMMELEQAADFDCAFIDSMVPHHAAAIPQASVVLRRSQDAQLQALARDIVDAQSREIGQMHAWRMEWCTAVPDAP